MDGISWCNLQNMDQMLNPLKREELWKLRIREGQEAAVQGRGIVTITEIEITDEEAEVEAGKGMTVTGIGEGREIVREVEAAV